MARIFQTFVSLTILCALGHHNIKYRLSWSPSFVSDDGFCEKLYRLYQSSIESNHFRIITLVILRFQVHLRNMYLNRHWNSRRLLASESITYRSIHACDFSCRQYNCNSQATYSSMHSRLSLPMKRFKYDQSLDPCYNEFERHVSKSLCGASDSNCPGELCGFSGLQSKLQNERDFPRTFNN